MADGTLNFSQRSTTPTNIPSGQSALYAKGDGYIYTTDVNGKERLVGGVPDGWIPFANSPVYYSSTSIKFTGSNVSNYFPIGTKIKLTQTTVKYFYVTWVFEEYTELDGESTILTLTGGSDYTVADAAITSFAYSHGLAYGFPEWFNYTPTQIGWTTSASIWYKFNIIGKLVSLFLSHQESPTSNSGTTTIGLPITCATNTIFDAIGQALIGASVVQIRGQIYSTTSLINFTYWDGSALPASGTKRIYSFNISYAIG